jgi:hypothetical protein
MSAVFPIWCLQVVYSVPYLVFIACLQCSLLGVYSVSVVFPPYLVSKVCQQCFLSRSTEFLPCSLPDVSSMYAGFLSGVYSMSEGVLAAVSTACLQCSLSGVYSVSAVFLVWCLHRVWSVTCLVSIACQQCSISGIHRISEFPQSGVHCCFASWCL